MSNQGARKEAIKSAYKEYFDRVDNFIEDDGSIDLRALSELDPRLANSLATSIRFTVIGERYRPSSIDNIETNNGWVRLEDRYSFPKEKGNYLFLTHNRKEARNYFNPNSHEDGYRDHFLKMYTHYMPNVKHPLPVY